MSGLRIAGDAAALLATLGSLALLLFLVAIWLGRWRLWLTGYLLVVLTLAAAFFFRDPVRVGERGTALFLAPADGRVVTVDTVPDAEYMRGDALRIAIYLSLFDVHVQRSPVDGVVDYVEHRPGRFAPAWSDRAEENEASAIGINAGETRVLVRQIAGTIARRIVTYAEEGERVDQAERIGLIRFGSRVETYLPATVRPIVGVGDRVRAGTTVIARAANRAGGSP